MAISEVEGPDLKAHVTLPKTATYKDLARAFDGVAGVRMVEVPRNEKSQEQHRGFGYVTFKDEAGFKKALSASLTIGDTPLQISAARGKSNVEADRAIAKRARKPKINPLFQVRLANVNHKSSQKAVIEAMREFGDISRVFLPLRRNGRDNIGRGVVTYEHEESAAAALKAAALTIDEQEVKVWRKEAVPPKEAEHQPPQEEETQEQEGGAAQASAVSKTPKPVMGPKEIFVGNLNFEWKEQEVWSYFRGFGELAAIEFPWHAAFELNHGYARLTFKEQRSAEAVVRQPEHFIKKWQVEVVGRTDFHKDDLVRERREQQTHVERRRERRKRKREAAELDKEERKRVRLARLGVDSDDEGEDVECAREEEEVPMLVEAQAEDGKTGKPKKKSADNKVKSLKKSDEKVPKKSSVIEEGKNGASEGTTDERTKVATKLKSKKNKSEKSSTITNKLSKDVEKQCEGSDVKKGIRRDTERVPIKKKGILKKK